MDLSDRLLECQYELTDRLAFYLCQKKPDHRTGQHFIIPEMADSSLDMSELAKAAKKKLQAVSLILLVLKPCIIWEIKVYTMAPDVVAPCVTRSSVAMVINM